MANFTVTEYKQAIAGIIAGVFLAFFGVDSYRGVVDPRPDPFTGTDGKFLKREIKYDLLMLEYNIRKSMPPSATRKRIMSIERCLEHNCTNFQTPTQDW